MANLAERAARLAKADLVTGMVGEFPELQGLMGGYYAAAQGEHPAVAAAIRDHYKPAGQGDEVPTDPVTVAVSLADKLDTIVSFLYEKLLPTGSKDPFALRRAALGAIALTIDNGLRFSLSRAIGIVTAKLSGQQFGRLQRQLVEELIVARENMGEILSAEDRDRARNDALAEVANRDFGTFVYENYAAPAAVAVINFFADRLKVQQREAGVRHDLIDAVFALGGEDDLVRLLARVRALQAFVGTEDGANLLAGYKRAANILKKEGYSPSPLVGEERRAGHAPGMASTARGAVDPTLGPLASASGKGEGGDANDAPAAPPHPSAPSGSHESDTFMGSPAPLPPSPTRREGQKTPSYTPEPAEDALRAALGSAEPAAAAAVEAEDFERAMAALASLRAPIDAFFDTVTVNDPDSDKRAARLALLDRVRTSVHQVADFSRIES